MWKERQKLKASFEFWKIKLIYGTLTKNSKKDQQPTGISWILTMMLNCHAKKMNWKDQAFLEKFFVIESSTLTGWEHFWATRFFVMWGWGLHPHQSKNSKISSHQKLPLLPSPPPSTPLHASLMILCIWQNGSASRRCPLLWKLRKTLSWCKTIGLNREFGCPFSQKKYPFWPLSDATLIFQIWPWYVADLILKITFGIPRFA